MTWLIVKYGITAAIVVLVSEIAQRSEKLGAIVAALPLISVLSLIWLYLDKQPLTRIADFSTYTFWYVVPTLPLFLLFPLLLQRTGFWIALSSSLLVTAVIVSIFAVVLRRFGISLI